MLFLEKDAIVESGMTLHSVLLQKRLERKRGRENDRINIK